MSWDDDVEEIKRKKMGIYKIIVIYFFIYILKEILVKETFPPSFDISLCIHIFIYLYLFILGCL